MKDQEKARRDVAPSARWKFTAIALVAFVTLLLRTWVILHCAEPDGDAKGHLGIARALLSDPFNVRIHWVWPPAYHYLLALLLRLGFSDAGVRFFNCALTAVIPFLTWRYAEDTLDDRASAATKLAPVFAGILCAAMPVVNLLGTSAEQGTVFAALVLLSVAAIDAGRFARGGVFLAAAALVRYEAWGAVGLLLGLRAIGVLPSLVRRLPSPVARASQLPFSVVVPTLLSTGAWFVAHRVADGSWFGFLREIYRYTHAQRETIHQDFLWFPVMQPYYLYGLTCFALFLFGIRRAWRVSFVVPLGIYLFLLASFTFKGALGSARYYESLTPFVCIAVAHGVARVGEWWRRAELLVFLTALVQVLRLLAQLGEWTFHVRLR